MTKLSALALASVLGLALIPAAKAQEFGGIPQTYNDSAPAAIQTGRSAFRAQSGQRPAPKAEWTSEQLEGLLSTHAGR